MSPVTERLELVTPGEDRQPAHRLTFLTTGHVLLAAWLLIAVAVILRAWVSASGSFYWDDFVVSGRGGALPLFSRDLLLYDHNGHLMPGGFFLGGIAAKSAPLDFWVPLIEIVILQLLTLWMSLRLLRRLFGTRPLILVPLGLLAITPLTLPPSTWWSAALNLLPLMVATAGLGLAAARHAAQPTWGSAVLGALWLVAGLVFFEKSLIAIVTALAVWSLVSGTSASPSAFLRDLPRGKRLWLVLIVVTVLYLMVYRSLATEGFRQLATPDVTLRLIILTIVAGVVPAMVGGPLDWTALGFGAALGNPPTWLVAISAQLVGAFVVVACVVVRKCRVPWLLVGLSLVIDLGTLLLARGGASTDGSLGQSLRYTADSAIIIAIALGASLMPVEGTAPDAGQVRLRARLARHGARTIAIVGVVGYLVLVLSLVSTFSLAQVVSDNPSKQWVANVKQSLSDNPNPDLFDAPVPADVYSSLGYPYNMASWVLSPLTTRPNFVHQVNDLRVLNTDGALVPAQVSGFSSKPGPNPGCGWPIPGTGGTVPVDGNFFPWKYAMYISYLAADDTMSTLSFGDKGVPQEAHFQRGAHETTIEIDGGGSVITFSQTLRNVGLCINKITVGDVKPVAGP